MITCKACTLVFTPREVLRPSGRELDRGDLPESLSVGRDGDRLRIVWPFDDRGAVVFAAVLFSLPGILAAVFVPVWYSVAFAVVVSALLSYFVLVRFTSHRLIVLDDESLWRGVRPIPSAPSLRLARADIDRFQLRKTPDRGRYGGPTVQLVARMRGGDEVVVLVEAGTEGPTVTPLCRLLQQALGS